MRRYVYAPPPRGATTDQLADYLNRQLRAIADALNQTLDWDKDYAEPPRPFDGMVRYADGTTWNPDATHGEGPYAYWDGEWHYLACCDEGGGGGGTAGCCWTMSAQAEAVALALSVEQSTDIFWDGETAEVYAPIPEGDCSALVVGSVTVQVWPTETSGGCPPTRIYAALWMREPDGTKTRIGLEHRIVGPTYTVESCGSDPELFYPLTQNVALNWTIQLPVVEEDEYDNYAFFIKIVYDASLTDIEPYAAATLSVALLPCAGG
jgi:hypothetical protein